MGYNGTEIPLIFSRKKHKMRVLDIDLDFFLADCCPLAELGHRPSLPGHEPEILRRDLSVSGGCRGGAVIHQHRHVVVIADDPQLALHRIAADMGAADRLGQRGGF